MPEATNHTAPEYIRVEAADVREGDLTFQGGTWGPVKRVEVHGEGLNAWLFIEWPSGMTMSGEPVHYRSFRRPRTMPEATDFSPGDLVTVASSGIVYRLDTGAPYEFKGHLVVSGRRADRKGPYRVLRLSNIIRVTGR